MAGLRMDHFSDTAAVMHSLQKKNDWLYQDRAILRRYFLRQEVEGPLEFRNESFFRPNANQCFPNQPKRGFHPAVYEPGIFDTDNNRKQAFSTGKEKIVEGFRQLSSSLRPANSSDWILSDQRHSYQLSPSSLNYLDPHLRNTSDWTKSQRANGRNSIYWDTTHSSLAWAPTSVQSLNTVRKSPFSESCRPSNSQSWQSNSTLIRADIDSSFPKSYVNSSDEIWASANWRNEAPRSMCSTVSSKQGFSQPIDTESGDLSAGLQLLSVRGVKAFSNLSHTSEAKAGVSGVGLLRRGQNDPSPLQQQQFRSSVWYQPNGVDLYPGDFELSKRYAPFDSTYHQTIPSIPNYTVTDPIPGESFFSQRAVEPKANRYQDPELGANPAFLNRLNELFALNEATKRWERLRWRRRLKKRSTAYGTSVLVGV
ncbi:unnamed protein product [Calicophoron daubneyi]|uniref:Uncharacterized protein n=1 Tax=Calicophoron daubneyi TaxID=300641 RepID=A0AAV2TAM0_CALDB